MRERHWLAVIGGYRQHREPMQVVSGPDYNRRVHYEAPPSDLMMTEMARFLAWYEGSRAVPALTRAGIAHFYFECIHPFEDGNGRIGRALAEKALAQSLGEPTLIALSRAIVRRQAAYYAALESAGRSLDVTDWLVGFADTVLAAQNWGERRLIRLIEQTRMFDRLRGQLNPRQEKALLRLFREEPDGFKGGAERRQLPANYSRLCVDRDQRPRRPGRQGSASPHRRAPPHALLARPAIVRPSRQREARSGRGLTGDGLRPTIGGEITRLHKEEI